MIVRRIAGLFGGESPAGTGTVPAGLRGHVVGVNVLEFTGTFAPQLRRFGRLYVETDGPPAVIDYRFVHYSSCGIWVDAFTYTQGDIAC